VAAHKDGPHADHHAIGFDADKKLLVGTDGGLWRLEDPGVDNPDDVNWTNLNGVPNLGEGLGTIQFIVTAFDPTDASVAYGGRQDNGAEKFTGSKVWEAIRLGDGGFMRVDPVNHLTVYHEYARTDPTVDIERTSNAGADPIKWKDLSGGLHGESNFYFP